MPSPSPDPKEILNIIFTFVSSSTVSQILFFLTICFSVLCVVCIYKVINEDPNKVPAFKKILTYFVFIFTVVLAFFVPISGYIFCGSECKKPTMSQRQAIDRLTNNSRVTWLIRLIPHYPDQTDLNVSSLKMIGHENHIFTFVADYHELVGKTVSDSVRRIGLALNPGQHVSAIIFPLNEGIFFPASAKGILQAIAYIRSPYRSESERIESINLDDIFPDKKDYTEAFLTDALANLRDRRSLQSWGWNNNSKYYQFFCKSAQNFRCGAHDEINRIARIGEDWHPFGMAMRDNSEHNICSIEQKYTPCLQSLLPISDLLENSFGARVFLIKNKPLSEITTRYLLQFDSPFSQIIPDIGATAVGDD